MNLHPPKLQEKVTIVMAPLEQYSVFTKAIDDLYKNTRHPFELIVIEGNAPDRVRRALEDRKKRHGNIRILYSTHVLRMAEAYNLSLVHIRTRYVFFMHNNILTEPGWLANLLCEAGGRKGVVCPYFSHEMSQNRFDIDFAYPVSYGYAHAHAKNIHGINLHGFLIDKESLFALGEFDEDLSTLLMSVDFNMRARSKGLDVRMDPKTILSYEPPASFKTADSRLFQRQWDREFTKRSFVHLQAKWGLRLDEPKYMEWLEKKLVSIHKKPSLTTLHPALKPHRALLGLQKLFQNLVRA